MEARHGPRAWVLGVAALLAWFLYVTWVAAPFLAVASAVASVREVRAVRPDGGGGRKGAAAGVVVAGLAVLVSGFGVCALVGMGR
ncbi:hypothetical protein [Streptomyces abikoensis]|uniref:hypothetical protein n=1 Tax=Streptomyces abikoensis TaxID=97398 RepID=UPI00167A8DFB|nr:hypothetical protein [Streptomyces abikoensis]GGP55298.1 hypothetical protein GCM10010214_30580 [Streptomyces abikoensis]